jgi:dGTPase
MTIDTGALGFGSGERAIYASNPWASRGRLFPEPGSLTRSEFQRDRDRIVHTTAFRRLKHKTQVFISPDGDHYRTRLTHTIEVAQVARALARALKLDEDLATPPSAIRVRTRWMKCCSPMAALIIMPNRCASLPS